MIERVDIGVGSNERAGGFMVGANQCVGRPRDGVLDKGEELDHLTINEREANRICSLASPGAEDPP